jgi:hypothetical protein|uniref:Nuclease associated modular domain-containing protein n=1 Tax=Micromonas pusilla TaxID=38833 RepID=A0A7R9T9R1_MICPS|mmetsp:Transcript_12102/g.43599  ORF Transcript_12102/g.43599 Transcript_12102/m.43599 type:complete len:503 (+) Transcript_12102:46-1554(+)
MILRLNINGPVLSGSDIKHSRQRAAATLSTSYICKGSHKKAAARDDIYLTTVFAGLEDDLTPAFNSPNDECARKAARPASIPLSEDMIEEGFFVRNQRHSAGCGCSVCARLRDMLDLTKHSADLSIRHAHFSCPIFVCVDDGFVVGKRQQRHHIPGCRCPNCNHLRFKRDAGIVKCVTLSTSLLHDLVGIDMCHQVVLDAECEALRRAKISAANKGNAAWNKGRQHSPETIARIKKATAKAMRNPAVRRKMREAAVRNSHSDTTKLKIRRTVLDNACRKQRAMNMAKSKNDGLRRGKVGVCTTGTFARRVSGVQSASFGIWTKFGLEQREVHKKNAMSAFRKVARQSNIQMVKDIEHRPMNAGAKRLRSNRGVPKTAEHRAAISAALKAKWEDPAYILSQKKASSIRKHQSTASGNHRARQKEELNQAWRRRAELVNEVQDFFSQATAAVKALEKQKTAGIDVDELMLMKALAAVAETRKVLESVETISQVDKTPGEVRDAK